MSDHPTPVIVKAPSVSAGRRMRARKSGFALLITITLLSFLVLLLVSLASLTRVETQVASNSQQLSQARQNALMALNIALGQLQKFTGPDQRTTARADMNSAWAGATTANGRWLGAYGNGAPVDTTYSLKPSQIPAAITGNSDAKGSQAKLLNWLVSGNEGTAFDSSSGGSNVGTDGHVAAAPASFAYTPSSAVNLATASAAPAIADTQALLVGSSSATATSDFVAAPLVTINAAAGTVPGLAAAVPIGRYAWWIGDEGAKARVNLPMASAAQAPLAFVSAQRVAIELVDGKNATGSTNATDLIGTAAYDSTLPSLPNLVSTRQLSMLTPTAATTLPAALKVRFHDLTASSVTVLADTYAGGLKKDLSAVLATGAASPADTDPLFVPDDIIAPATYNFAVPTWGQLRSFAQTTAPSAGIDPRLPTSTQTGIFPVLSYAALGLQYVAPVGDGLGNPIRLAMYPLVVLWNPYTVPIKAAQYEFGFIRRYHGKLQLQVMKTPATTYPWTVKETIDMNRGGSLIAYTPGVPRTLADGSADVTSVAFGGFASGSKPADSYVRFIIDVTQPIPAGQSLIFTLQGSESGKDYNAPNNGKPTNVMTNGLNAIGHVLLNYGATVGPGESGQPFRVAVYGYANPDRNMFYPADSTTHMSGGGGDAYIGQVVSAGPTGFLPSATNDKQWYQALSGSTMSGDSKSVQTGGAYPSGGYPGAGYRNAFLQTAAPLTPATGPTSVMSFNRMFSSASVNTGIFPDVRWIAQSNPRAPYTTHAIADRGVNPMNMTGGGGMQTPWQDFVADPTGKRASSGTGLDAGTTVTDTTLFEFRPDTQPLMSIGQMQHADMSWIGSYPAYAIGNSLADPHFKDVAPSFTGMLGQIRRDESSVYNSSQDVSPGDQTTNYYDISWLLNRVMWDRYFVSTVPHAGTGTATDTNATAIPTPLPNPRHVRYGSPSDASLRDADKAAANLLLKGGFNINSTSEQAWRAVLGGINQLAYDPVTAASGVVLKAALPRFSKPTAAANSSNAWQGYRALTDDQIAQFAQNIVGEIRNRGPFVSLADFVNRRLVDNTSATSPVDERLKGVLQAALDATVSGTGATNAAAAPFSDAPTYSSSATYMDPVLMRGGTTSTPPYSSQSAFAPGYLTQADILSAIGAGLSARSDTFTIRTYGEAVNPATQTIQGRAWCEAVVQRLPDYLDSTTDPNAYSAPTASINKTMGRRYKIISFRWLSSNDI